MGQAPTLADVYSHATLLELFRTEPAAALRCAELLARVPGVAPQYIAIARIISNWARCLLPFAWTTVGELRRAIAEYFSLGSRLGGPIFLGLLAEREADDQNIEEALRTIGEALAQASETGERWAEAFVHRVRGDILLKRDPKNPEPSEGAYRTAIAIAKQQGARSYALFASPSRLPNSTNRMTAPPKRTLSSRQQSKVFRRLRRCLKSRRAEALLSQLR